MKLAALCCTFHRPHLLGQLIESFLRQDYPRHLRELVILDDAGQYENQAGEGWRLISLPARFCTLGEKRNACAALAAPDAEGFLVADDDDVYLPHWFSTQAEAMKRADWSRPSLVLLAHGDGLKEHDTGGLYHGGWALRRSAFDAVRGYAALNNGEDQDLAKRLHDAKVSICDPCEFARPFYHYRVDTGSYHLSYLDDAGYRDLGKKTTKGKHKLQPGWPRDFTRLPVVRRFTTAPHVSHRDGRMLVELIGPVHAPGRDGPTNGMYALQKELRKRIAGGLDWLSIKSLPASDGALPWFWHWDDRRYAVWWESEGRPFVQGPNMLFTYSWKPRIDAEERGLLDAANCRAMFCHSDWYRDLIAKNRGPANTSPIVTWPYPIDPWPGEPLPDQYDLLIYSKNGHRPGLLEHLCETFPRHVVLHYGQYKREQLFEAARRSRACAYLADDDHGPLALQEILLAGCPVVGVRTGAPFIQDGVTGVFVDRLPPGAKCVKNKTTRTKRRWRRSSMPCNHSRTSSACTSASPPPRPFIRWRSSMGYSSNWNGLVVIPKTVLFARDQPNGWPLGSDADKAITRTWEQGRDTESLPDPSGPVVVVLSPPQHVERQRQSLGRRNPLRRLA
ncbi:MAG: glycosyltransferase [Gemmataceae bacterium]